MRDIVTIRDTYRDTAEVSSSDYPIRGKGRVYLDVTERPGKDNEVEASLSLTPKQAKRLAKAIRKAAKAAKAVL